MSTNATFNPFPIKNEGVPFHNVNGDFVNKTSSNNPANFGSNEIPTSSLHAIKNNVAAAAASAIKGGSKMKILKRNLKKISSKYKKMKGKKGSKKMTFGNLKKKLSHLLKSQKLIGGKRKHRTVKRRRTRKTRGGSGYHQYMSNVPFTPSYKVAGVDLNASSSALANPPPITRTNNCVDNLNAVTNKGFQFW